MEDPLQCLAAHASGLKEGELRISLELAARAKQSPWQIRCGRRELERNHRPHPEKRLEGDPVTRRKRHDQDQPVDEKSDHLHPAFHGCTGRTYWRHRDATSARAHRRSQSDATRDRSIVKAKPQNFDDDLESTISEGVHVAPAQGQQQHMRIDEAMDSAAENWPDVNDWEVFDASNLSDEWPGIDPMPGDGCWGDPEPYGQFST